MEVSCASCPARFAVPDDKVRGRKVRIACKRCGAPIVVDGTTLGATGTAAPGAPGSAPKAGPAPTPSATKPAATAAAPRPAATAGPVSPPRPAAAPVAAASAPASRPAVTPGPASQPRPGAAPASAPRPATAATPPRPAALAPTAQAAPSAQRAPAAAPVSEPRPAAGPRPAPAADGENDWSTLSESDGKTVAWREPAALLPRPASVPRPGAAKTGGLPKKTMLGGLEAPRGAAPAPPVADRLGTAAKPPSARSAATAKPEPADAEPEWTVALTDDQHEEMRTAEVVELYARGSIDQETFIWAEGMEDWKRPWEIPVIAAALAARGLKPKAETREPDFPMDEPAEDDATIVASVGGLMPPSSRGKVPSGVWHEPGRDDDDREVGYEDVTVSLDGKSAQQLLSSLGAARVPQKSGGELLAEQFDDAPTRVHDEPEPAPPSARAQEVDDLLADMDERTLALEDAFRADSRPLSAADLLGEDDRTLEQSRPVPGGTPLVAAPSPPQPSADSFSLDRIMASTEPLAQPPAQDLFAGVDLAPPPAGRDRPLDSLWEPTSIQHAASPPGAAAGVSGPYPALAPPTAPVSPAQSAPGQSRLGCVLLLLLLVVLLGGGAAASFFTKQPASLYGPDGMPRIPGLAR